MFYESSEFDVGPVGTELNDSLTGSQENYSDVCSCQDYDDEVGNMVSCPGDADLVLLDDFYCGEADTIEVAMGEAT